MPYLLFPGGECPAHELKPGRSLLGRTEKCSIVVTSEGLSREHAAVDLEGGHVYVSDLGSKNGVFVNDKKAEGRVRLADGDKVRFGLVDALFVGDQVAAPAPAPRWGQGAQAQPSASAAPTALPPPELAKFAAQAGAKPVPADLERFMKNVLAPTTKPAEAETPAEAPAKKPPPELERFMRASKPAAEAVPAAPPPELEPFVKAELAPAEPAPEPVRSLEREPAAEKKPQHGKSGREVRHGSAKHARPKPAPEPVPPPPPPPGSSGELPAAISTESTDSNPAAPAAPPEHHARRHGKRRPAAAAAGPLIGVAVAGGLAFLAFSLAKHQGESTVVDSDSHGHEDKGVKVVVKPSGTAAVGSGSEVKVGPRPTPLPTEREDGHEDETPPVVMTPPPPTPGPGPSTATPSTADPQPTPVPDPGSPVATPVADVKQPPSPDKEAEEEKASQEKVLAELDELLRAADSGDAQAKSTVKKFHFVALRNEASLPPGVAERVARLVRLRIEHAEYMRLVPLDKLNALKGSALKLECRELQLRTTYTQDYSKGYGRLTGKFRLSPHPKSIKIEIYAEGGAKPLVSFTGATPNLDKTVEGSSTGLSDGEVWDATIHSLDKPLGTWPGKI